MEKKLFCTDYLEIAYEQKCGKLAKQVSDILLADTERILQFFNLSKLRKSTQVIIYSDVAEYIAHLEQCGQVYQEWMIADTFDGRINLLSLEECCKTVSHKNMRIEDYSGLILHEFVHICQQEVNPNAYGCIWFWEALATNLSGQSMKEAEISCTPEELMFHYMELPDAYAISYRLGKYMLEHLSHEQIYAYIVNPDSLWRDTESIMEAAGREPVPDPGRRE